MKYYYTFSHVRPLIFDTFTRRGPQPKWPGPPSVYRKRIDFFEKEVCTSTKPHITQSYAEEGKLVQMTLPSAQLAPDWSTMNLLCHLVYP